MSPRLLPPTWLRHVLPALLAGAAALVGWWCATVGIALLERADPTALGDPDRRAALVLGLAAALASASQVGVEGRCERLPVALRGVEVLVAPALSLAVAVSGVVAWDAWVGMPDDTLALRVRLPAWTIAGGSATFGPWAVRGGRRVVEAAQRRLDLRRLPPPPEGAGAGVEASVHLLAGLASGLLAAEVWYLVGLDASPGDRFLAGAAGCWTLGAVSAGLCWSPPLRLYRAELRVVVGGRPGARAALDPVGTDLATCFVGHLPVGLDLHLPAADGVAELHAVVRATGPGTFAARGLSTRTTGVRRLLETVDLTWDPALAAPLETPLVDGDRLWLGAAELELVVVPREVPR